MLANTPLYAFIPNPWKYIKFSVVLVLVTVMLIHVGSNYCVLIECLLLYKNVVSPMVGGVRKRATM